MPESVTDRPTKAHEYIFLLTKSSRYYWDADSVREENQPCSVERSKYGWNGISIIDIDGKERRAQPDQTDKMGDRWANPAGRNIRTVWNIATAPTNFSKETSHHRRVARDEVSDGTICIPSPDCRLHEGLAAQVARGFCDEPAGDLLARIESIYDRLFREQRLGCAPIRQPIVSDLEEQNLDCSSLAYSPLAIDHNNEIHRMALALDSTPAYIPFFEILSRIGDKRALLVSFVRHLCIYGSSMVVGDFSEHLLPKIPHHIVDTSFAQVLRASETPCTCLYYQHYTRKSDHFATYPPKLVEPMIKAGSKPGDIVLDPFAGSGTTLMVARSLGRHAIGLDLSFTYLHDQARKRLELDKLAAWSRQ